MSVEVEITVGPDDIENEEFLMDLACRSAGLSRNSVSELQILKRSVDARKDPVFRLKVLLVKRGEVVDADPLISDSYIQVADKEEVIIIGAGPAGYFAALKCLQQGIRPIVLERGKDARARRRDLRAIQQDGIVDPNSNYCFGEGGAGTYSDGKLYTRSKKRGNVQEILQILVEHGAEPDIKVDAHPHIGSNKLPGIISNIRETIENFGGKVLFDHQVIDLEIVDGEMRAVITGHGRIAARNVILATGHSARDIYSLLVEKEIEVEAKPFALGLRIEHPQMLIDEMQYGQNPRHHNLPAASYGLTCNINKRGVFSFCMCPGGLIVPASTAPGEIVVNGMSLSRRDSPYANAGIVVSVSVEHANSHGFEGPLACMNFQREIEQRMFENGDGSQRAPAQLLPDFIAGRASGELRSTSYIPGVYAARLDQLLPRDIYIQLREAFPEFERKMKGFVSRKAMLVGVESRTSAPVRIPRSKITCEHPQVKGLFPCGEGAGYAGGIVSAAIDGQVVATAIAKMKND